MNQFKTIILTGLLCAAASAQAADADRTDGHIGMGAGAAAGALIGGPPGAIVGAGLGAWMGDRAGRAADAEALSAALVSANTDAESLETRLAAATAAIRERDAVITELERRQALARDLELEILFRTDSDRLDHAFAQRIARLAELLRAHPGLGVRLDGYADARGASAHNERLSAARTAAVRDALLERGVSADRIVGFHHGADGARADRDDPDALALDRRVVIRLEPTGARVADRSAGH